MKHTRGEARDIGDETTMLVAMSYEWHARQWIDTMSRQAARGSRGFADLMGEAFARAMIEEPWDSLRGAIEQRLEGAVSHRRPFFVPWVALEKACLAALLRQPAAEYLRAGVDALAAAEADADSDDEPRKLASWAVALLAWLGDVQPLMEWKLRREQLPPAAPVAETALLAFAREIESSGARARAPAGTEAMLALDALRMLDDHQVLVNTVLLARAETRSTDWSAMLAEGRAFINGDLWPEGDPYKGRAVSDPVRWIAEKERLRARVPLTGTGGRIRAVAPFMSPAYAIVQDLDRFVLGEHKASDIENGRSKARVQKLLADPGATVELVFEFTGSAFLAPEDIAPCQDVLDAAHEWLTNRHGDAFRARLALAPG